MEAYHLQDGAIVFENIKMPQIVPALLSFSLQFIFPEPQRSLAVTLPEMDVTLFTLGQDFDAKKDWAPFAHSRNSCVMTRQGKCHVPLLPEGKRQWDTVTEGSC